MDVAGFHNRLRSVIGGESVLSFSKKCSVPDSLLRKYLKGKTLPGMDKLVSIAVAGRVTIKWLATGEGPMTAAEELQGEVSEEIRTAIKDITSRNEFSFIERYHSISEIPGRYPVLIQAHKEWVVLRKNYVTSQMNVNPDGLIFDYVRTDNMEPLIKKGDMIIIDSSQKEVREEGIYYVNIRDTMTIRRVQVISGNKVKLSNDNAAYSDSIIVDKDRSRTAQIIGKVVWFGRAI